MTRRPSRVTNRTPTPAPRIEAYGAGILSDAELVAVILEDEGNLAAARALLAEANLVALVRRAKTNPATPALRKIAAAVELARRATDALRRPRRSVDIKGLAAALVLRHAFDVQEHVGAVLVDTRQQFITARLVFVGSHRRALVATRDIVRVALAYHADGVIVYHNHPSGDPTPSEEDRWFTEQLEAALKVMNLTLVDHLILGAGAAYLHSDGSFIVPRTGCP